MKLVEIVGSTPGNVLATVRHQGMELRLPVELTQHPLGGWQARRSGQDWSLRCREQATAILLEAGGLFANDDAPTEHPAGWAIAAE
ncbi:MAG TPA: hypothetical protein VMI52_10555 [Acetobacteraceae bacterium]|nr:hypothetical protein [Acetobacteraceae bacterium]